jgi:DNA-binding response OmpR family regulator
VHGRARESFGLVYHFWPINEIRVETDTALESPLRMGQDARLPTVLVVDDDASLRLLCRVNLELDGYRVLEAREVAEAEELLVSELVDLVLLDVHVGPESGIDLMRSVRERGSAPPIVLVTGSARLDAETQAEADGVVAKPFRLEELLGVVRRLVSR